MASPFDPAPAPPPECPAHALGDSLGSLAHAEVSEIGPGGLRRLYGPAHEKDPMGLYEKLRAEHGPVAPVLINGDVPAWLVLGHSENLHMTRTPSLYSRDSRRWRLLHDGTVTMNNPLAPIFAYQAVCVFADGAEHERQRGAVTDSIARIDHRGVRRFINRFSNRLVNDFCQDGHADLVSRFAEHLPMMVMCQIIGMPEEYNERLVQAARDMIKGTETAIASNEYVMAALGRLVARRRAQPEEDFATWIVAHHAEFSDDEAAQHLRLVLIAAYETTANLISNVLRMVLTDPRFRAQLSGGHMTLPEAVEQTLWDEPPFTTILGRWAAGDSELGGQKIKAGDALIINMAAANVDPVVRPDPAASMQGNRAHLAFSGGPHECPGQDIGRAIADTGIDALLMRLPDIQLAVEESELRWRSSLMSRHLIELPVSFASRAPQEIAGPPTPTPRGAPRQDWQVASPPPPAPAPAPAVPAPAPAFAGPPPEAVASVPQPGAVPQAPHTAPPAATIPVQRRGSAPVRMWRRLATWWRGY